jgi:excisionase family DNA binding protein
MTMTCMSAGLAGLVAASKKSIRFRYRPKPGWHAGIAASALSRKVPRFLIKDAASLLGVSDDTVRRWAEAGRIEMTAGGSGWLTVDGGALAKLPGSWPRPPTRGTTGWLWPTRRATGSPAWSAVLPATP